MKEAFNIKFDILSGQEDKLKGEQLFNNIYAIKKKNRIIFKIWGIRALFILYEYKKILKLLDKYIICHIHSLNPSYGLLTNSIKKKCKYLIISFYGSDYYRKSKYQKKLQENILKKANIITFTNKETLNSFNKYFKNKYSDKIKVVRFGLKPLEYIDLFRDDPLPNMKSEFNIPKNSFVVTCGYNASKGQQHEKIIKSLELVRNKLPDNVYFVFPMSYGNEKYIFKIKTMLNKSKLKYIILKEFYSSEKVARLRLLSDIMIHVQISDQFSGSMQEYIYADNVVITGNWLPYQTFKDYGIYMEEVSSIEEIGKKTLGVINNYKKYKAKSCENKYKIWELSSWESNGNKWMEIYSEIIANKQK